MDGLWTVKGAGKRGLKRTVPVLLLWTTGVQTAGGGARTAADEGMGGWERWVGGDRGWTGEGEGWIYGRTRRLRTRGSKVTGPRLLGQFEEGLGRVGEVCDGGEGVGELGSEQNTCGRVSGFLA